MKSRTSRIVTNFILTIIALGAISLAACALSAGPPGNEEESSPPPSAAGSADLASLNVSPGSLNPAFSADVTSYTVMVENAVTSVTVSGAPLDSEATVTAPVSVTGLEASVPRMATITVTPTSGSPKNYRVLITRTPGYPAGTPVYVNRANADDGDGTLNDPFRSVQNAVNVAPDGAEILVAQGIYAENIVLRGNSSVTLRGGYQSGNYSVRDPAAYVTTLQGDGTAPVLRMRFTGGGYDPRGRVAVNGFTVTGGTQGLSFDSDGNGGKMDLVISDNVIEGNGTMLSGLELLPLWGGGINASGNGMVSRITGNLIRNNASGKGAGMSVHLYDDPDEEIYIADNVIEDNVAHNNHGGGVYLSFLRGAFSGNVIRGNRIGETEGYGWGGGMIVDGGMRTGYSDSVFIQLSGNVYSGNYAPTIGGGVFIDEGANVRMTRELVYGNTISDADNRGGAGIYVDGPRAVTAAKTVLSYCTVAGNTGVDTSFGNAIYLEVGDGLVIDALVEADHCIFWNNHTAAQTNKSDFYGELDPSSGRYASLTVADSTYQYGCAGSGDFSATGCSNDNPEFVDPENGDYHTALTDRGVYAE